VKKYKIKSVVDDFIKADQKIRQESSLKKKISVWTKFFSKPHQELFNVYHNWGWKKYLPIMFKNYDKKYKIAEIKRNEKTAQKLIPEILQKISKVIVPKNQIPTILFVGLHLTNGFVDKYKNKYTTFLNLESYDDAPTLKIFITHELLHNIHLQKNPGIYYWKGNRASWYHSLILEGVATYLTKRVLKVSAADALWGKYLNKKECQQFMAWCKKNKSKLKRQLLVVINKTKREESSFFGGRRPRGCPYYRTGYYLGLDFVENLSRRMSLEKIVLLKGEKLKKEIINYLEN